MEGSGAFRIGKLFTDISIAKGTDWETSDRPLACSETTSTMEMVLIVIQRRMTSS